MYFRSLQVVLNKLILSGLCQALRDYIFLQQGTLDHDKYKGWKTEERVL